VFIADFLDCVDDALGIIGKLVVNGEIAV